MSDDNSPRLQELKKFLRTIQRPGLSIDRVDIHDDLVHVGLIDSLALIQITLYLEQTYNIDFSIHGFNPEQLSTMANILQFIEEAGT